MCRQSSRPAEEGPIPGRRQRHSNMRRSERHRSETFVVGSWAGLRRGPIHRGVVSDVVGADLLDPGVEGGGGLRPTRPRSRREVSRWAHQMAACGSLGRSIGVRIGAAFVRATGAAASAKAALTLAAGAAEAAVAPAVVAARAAVASAIGRVDGCGARQSYGQSWWCAGWVWCDAGKVIRMGRAGGRTQRRLSDVEHGRPCWTSPKPC